MRIAEFFGEQLNVYSKAEILSKLNKGDVVRAKVLEVAADKLLLKLSDGNTISAALMNSINVKKGEQVELVVKDTLADKVFLETVKTLEQKNIQLESEIKNELMDIGAKSDKKGVEIARQIKESKLPLEKEVFNKVMETVETYKGVSIEKAVYLLSKNIIPLEKNISCLNQIVDEKYKIGDELNKLFDNLVSIKDENTNNLLKTFLTKNLGIKTEASNEKANVEVKPQLILEKLGEELKNNKISPKVQNAIKEKVIEFFKNENLNSKDPKQFAEFLKNIDFTEKGFINAEKESMDKIIKGIFEKINFEKKDTPVIKESTKILTENDKREALEKVFDKFCVKMNDSLTKEELNMKNIYREIYREIESIKQVLEQAEFSGKGDVFENIDNLQSNLRFLNELNNHNTYIQIPLNVFDKNHTGELYILKKKPSKKSIDMDDVSLFLSLNTQNLGQVDSLVNVNKKNVSVNIRAESKKVINFIKKNYTDLYNVLLKKGYKLVDIKYRMIEEKVDILNVNDIEEINTKRQKFDYKI
ncbi:flagellar hook-length control protein FliK [Herbivorax sp. ANBcel31]|uniref:flagellar hook-length control protein FliK n=1 Tax=Herbivorax sp. ANBcel31 TaxID=3069754 RepID=UPI0027B78A1D|nr:flagellar hook-length control protein FliK [Herbivorax sp. ANBcel31]MDQ2087204.1 flagellar hook-length control protein FliK [Herbivorax sp. ANBcel31]